MLIKTRFLIVCFVVGFIFIAIAQAQGFGADNATSSKNDSMVESESDNDAYNMSQEAIGRLLGAAAADKDKKSKATSLAQTIKETETTRGRIELDRLRLTNSVTNLEQQVSTLESELKTHNDAITVGKTNGTDAVVLKTIQDKSNELSANISTTKATIENNNRQLSNLSQKLITTKTEKLQAQIELLKLHSKVVSSSMDFMELSKKLEDVDDTLDAIEHELDKTELGAYFQDKIGQLLNSQIFCAAVKNRCGQPNPVKLDPQEIREELFPSSNSKAVRSEYYDHVNSRDTKKKRDKAGAAQ